jgi:hypothetical protein
MQITMTQFVHYKRDEFTGKATYALFNFDASSSCMGYVKICESDVTFEIPDNFNPVAAQIEALSAEEAKVRKEFNDRISAIKEQISKLQCLEFSGDVVDAEVSRG